MARRRWLLGAEACAGIVFLCDAAATLTRLGWERYRAKHWRLVFVGTAAFVVLDSLFCFVALFFHPRMTAATTSAGGAPGSSVTAGGDDDDDVGAAAAAATGAWRWRWRYWLLLHPTRCLRPLLIVAHHRPMRHLVSSMLRTLPRLANTIALVGAGAVLFTRHTHTHNVFAQRNRGL